ncbi:hypothetical protein GCM10027160_48110 [Streptomyces calidiresistens]
MSDFFRTVNLRELPSSTDKANPLVGKVLLLPVRSYYRIVFQIRIVIFLFDRRPVVVGDRLVITPGDGVAGRTG